MNEEKEVVVRQNKNITESINYAQRIQQAILPPQSEVDKLFNESFIYFKPKDIVSGDFYWINAKNGKSYVAAVDCTGHGVPGAFMSMIGYNILEKILGENAALSPADILTKLSDEITKALRQGSEGVTVKDGMDMSLITIDNHNMEMEFAGAYNPIYLVRNKALTEYKANKVAIGKETTNPVVALPTKK